MPASSWARWTSPTSTSSRGCRRRSRSTRRPLRGIPARRWAPSPRCGTTCASSTPGSGWPTAPRTAPRWPARPPPRSSTGCWSWRRGPGSRCWPRWCGAGKASTRRCLKDLASQGFSRARIDGEVRDLTEDIRLDRYYQHTIEVVVDRLVAKAGIDQRLTQSVETALNLADGVVDIDVVEGPTLTFSQHLACPVCGLSFDELQPRNFSFNSPYGACGECSGIGTRYQVDPELVVPDPDRSVADGAISPWSGRNRMQYYQRMLEGLASELGLRPRTPPGRRCPNPPARRCCTGPGPRRSGSATPTGSGGSGSTRPPTRGWCRSWPAATRGPSRTGPGSGTRSTCGRCPATPAAGAGSTRSPWRSPSAAGASTRWRRCRCGRPTSSWTGSSSPSGRRRSPNGC
jgi:hypothetical protein